MYTFQSVNANLIYKLLKSNY